MALSATDFTQLAFTSTIQYYAKTTQGFVVKLKVLADPNESVPIVGRDVLNQFRIVLDGPNQVMIVE